MPDHPRHQSTETPCPRAPMRPVEFVADCPACERPSHIDPSEWEQVTSGAFAAHGPSRWPVCEYCKTQFEVVAVRVVPVGENSPAQDDDALAAELAADPAIAASLAEWERTSGPPHGENSPAGRRITADMAEWRKRWGRPCCLDCKAWAQLVHLDDKDRLRHGRCHRHAPRAHTGPGVWDADWIEADWPLTCFSDWCMEHVAA